MMVSWVRVFDRVAGEERWLKCSLFSDMFLVSSKNSKLWFYYTFWAIFFAAHLKSDKMIYYQTREMTLETVSYPGVPNRLDIDGECVPIKGTVNIAVQPQLCNLIV